MNNIRPFQIVLIGVFASFAIFGVLFFALFKGSLTNEEKAYGDSVIIWGTFNERAVSSIITDIGDTDGDFNVVKYRQFDERNFNSELLNAISEGRSPDLIMLASKSLVQQRAKMTALSYETISERDFRDAYVDGADIFMLSDGVYGIPFAVDPMVMYWNKDVFAGSGLALPPRTWEQLVSETTPAITRVSRDLDIERSTVAFGEYSNITHAKDIMSMLFFQSGTNIVEESSDGYEVSLLGSAVRTEVRPADAALQFYTQFAVPSNVSYSWNRSLANDKRQFLSGELGMYFGFGSELEQIRVENPNLNFDVAPIPQGSAATILRGYGTFYAFSIPKASKNPQGAYKVAQVLAGASVDGRLAEAIELAPARRSEIARSTNDPYRQVFYQAALIARGWLDPNPVSSENVFRIMIEDVTSGRERISKVVADAAGRLRLLF